MFSRSASRGACNAEVFRHHSVFDYAACFPSDRTSSIIGPTFAPPLRLRHDKQVPCRVPNQPEAVNHPAIIEDDVQVSLDYFLATEAELNSCNVHFAPGV